MIIISAIFISFLFYLFDFPVFTSLTIGVFIYLISRLLFKSRTTFAFRELTLFLYAINYLISPAITYSLDQSLVKYPMKIPADEYFILAFPGFILFSLGIYSLKTNCFQLEINKIKDLSNVNESFLRNTVLIGLVLKIALLFIQGELNFIVYLFGLIRFVGAFSLFSINPKKYFIWPIIVLFLELALGFINGAYHDAIMWVIFFGLFYVYAIKPKIYQVVSFGFATIILLLIIQVVKYEYRSEVWEGNQEASTETVIEVGSKQIDSEIMFGQDNLLGTLNRGNQAWIFASTVDNMDRNKGFQGMTVVNKYVEAAILPRFLAPNKIESGDQEIFNTFSGHTINENTSMGLGIFADGYVAYGATGVYIFAFALGLIFSLTFKLVERWTKVSPFYVLLLLPLLNYAVRPDCELQTTINHLFKGILLYGFLVYLTRKRFTLDSAENQRKLNHLNLMK